jgi:hypothetical protein
LVYIEEEGKMKISKIKTIEPSPKPTIYIQFLPLKTYNILLAKLKDKKQLNSRKLSNEKKKIFLANFSPHKNPLHVNTHTHTYPPTI